MSNQSARRRRELARQRDARQQRAHQANLAQQAAAVRADLKQKRRHKIEAGICFGVAVLIAVTHLLEHGGAISIMSQGLQDLLIGYPTAALLALFGFIRLGT